MCLQGWENSIGSLPDDQLPKRVKLSLLQQNVKTPASECISFYAQIDENYDKALSSLKKKYGDEEKLIDCHIEELLSLKSKDLSVCKLYDNLTYLVHSLETLKVDRNQYAVILVPLLKSSFSVELRHDWAKYEYAKKQEYNHTKIAQALLTPPTIPPALNRLTMILDFLSEQVDIQESSGSIDQKKPEEMKKSPPPKPASIPETSGTAVFVATDRDQKKGPAPQFQKQQSNGGKRGKF